MQSMSREQQEEMMKRFNVLNEEYNKRTQNMLYNRVTGGNISNEKEKGHNLIDDEDNRNFVGGILTKMNDDFNKMLDEMKRLIDKRPIYENHLQKCKTLIEKLRECNHLYNNISPELNPEFKKLYPDNIVMSSTLVNDNVITPLSILSKNLENHINMINIDIQTLRSKLLRFQKFVTDVSQIKSSKLLCSVCYTNDITHCLNPCGHTYCKTCIDKMSRNCAGCRSIFTSSIKLFIQENNDTDISLLDAGLQISGNDNISSISGSSLSYAELTTINTGLSINTPSNLSAYDESIAGMYFT